MVANGGAEGVTGSRSLRHPGPKRLDSSAFALLIDMPARSSVGLAQAWPRSR